MTADLERETKKTTRQEIVEGIAIGLIVLSLLAALRVLAEFSWLEPTNGGRELEQAGVLLGGAGAFWWALVNQRKPKKKSIPAGVLIALGGALIALAWWMGYSA
ncbi:MAG: hypothetical protein OEQ49_17720 [Myxococcales bacterium]|nr:hypothetical protein [Myxococcales bacterium]